MYQNQTEDDTHVDFSRPFQETHTFSCVLLYIWIRKNRTVCIQATINFVYFFPNFCLALDENASCFDFESFNSHAKQTFIRAD